MSAGLYIHVPFCARKCGYCDFFSTPYEESAAQRWLGAIEREWQLVRSAALPHGETFTSVYVGGGTPSVLNLTQWRRLAAIVGTCTGGATATEFTLECNPESFDSDKARAWIESGVTRLSLGVQSLEDNLLGVLGRPHGAERALEVLRSEAVRQFGAVGVDVMYGVPGQTLPQVRGTLEKLLATGVVKHVSAYELTLSTHSPMGREPRVVLPAEDSRVEMYHAVEEQLAGAGFEHYEVSNYALPGYRSRHNSAYWRHEPYVGLGPSAHSFVMPRRWSNVADTGEYAAALERGERPVACEETLGREELAREALMLGLRTSQGLDAARFRGLTGEDLEGQGRGPVLQRLVSRGLLVKAGENYVPTPSGMLLADALTLELLG